MTTNLRSWTRRAGRLAVAAALIAGLAAPVAAQQSSGDRRLLADGTGNPYLFLLFDTSASMNWATTCSQSDLDDGKCDYVCTTENCPVPMNGDDGASKLAQAKWALYKVLTDDELNKNIRFGFASLNQDKLGVATKHWLYTVTSVTGSLPNGTPQVPIVGWQEVWGPITPSTSGGPSFNYGCDRLDPTTNSTSSSAANYEVGCYGDATDAVDMDTNDQDAWKLAKLQRLPKGGADGRDDVTYYLQKGTGGNFKLWKVTHKGTQTAIDYATTGEFDAKVDIDECNAYSSGNPKSCTSWKNTPTELTVHYSRMSGGVAQNTSFLFWEGVLRKNTKSSDHTKEAFLGGFPDAAFPSNYTSDGVDNASDAWADETCRGWEPSGTSYPSNSGTVTEVDPYPDSFGYDLRFPDEGLLYDPGDPNYEYLFELGDVIPWDWRNDAAGDPITHLDDVLERLAPAGAPADIEDSGDDTFKQAVYFADAPQSGESFLRLKDENQRPLLGVGKTPLAGWFSFFRSWYSGCGKPGNCSGTGWSDFAAAQDPNFACSKKYVLMITDGNETCDGSPQEPAEDYYDDNETKFPPGFEKGQNADQCRYRASLKSQEGVESLVLAFGAENKSKLQCANTPVVYVENKEELVTEIAAFLAKIQEEAAAFASAAVPTVQANILDKVYLSSFIPLNDEAIWPGRLDAFLKPLPLDADGFPDRDAACQTGDQSECFAWDAGDSQLAWNGEVGYDPQGLLKQAPWESEIVRYDNSSLDMGTGADQRRVYFGLPDATTIGKRQIFQYPDIGTVEGDARPEQANYEYAWDLSVNPAGSDLNRDQIAGIIEFTLKEKQAQIDQACTAGARLGDSCSTNADCDSSVGAGDGVCTADAHIQYLMGDIFHSNPLVVNPPGDFNYYTKDLYWGTSLCGQTVEDTELRGPQISYSWFANKNLCRRQMILVGSDDGQLHAFDAGIFQGTDCKLALPAGSPDEANNSDPDGDGIEGKYDYGTGRELFSFIPDAMMPVVKSLSEIDELSVQYGIDGTMRSADVFIDPVLEADGTPTCLDRQWRTVLLGNYREGGPGIFALDITQPDLIDSSSNVPEPLAGIPSYVPSCAEGASGCHPACTGPNCEDMPFPALLWEFRDLDALGQPADDDVNGETDMAESWSRPVVARLQVCDGDCGDDNPARDRFVAIFGGGLSETPYNSSADATGNWLYIVDIETGQLLYKRGGEGTSSSIIGSVAADVTAIDDDNDKIVDTLYFGTTAGYVYKVLLGNGPLSTDDDGLLKDRADESQYLSPFQIFSTGGRPIYLEINAVYVAKMKANALLFGTGSRWDLWEFNSQAGRFYALVDQNWVDESPRDGLIDVDTTACPSCTSPLTENVYQAIDPSDTVTAVSNYLYGSVPGTLPGWYFTLEADEKLISEPFTLGGVSFFTVYSPVLSEKDNVCAYSGESKIFTVNTVTTKGYAIQSGSTERTRFITAPTFTTQPFVESSATANKPGTTTRTTSDQWTTELAEINADLRRLFPPGARFANYTLDIKTVRSDTGIVFIAPVPVAVEAHNWKEF